MNLPLSWLKDYMDTDGISNKEYADKLTMSGSIVEGIENPADEFKNVVVGKITKIDKHPDADKLVVCQVDVGEGEDIQIVTGAPNVFEGAVVPVAKHKSLLPGGVKITKGKLRGVVSQGMMCSTDELGISKERATGILILPDNTPIGEDITKVLGLDESVAEFEITSNRPDCMSIIGLARESAATFNREFKIPEIKETGNGEDANDYASVEITDPELCPRYIGRVVKNVKIGPSPEWMQHRLTACGLRAINNIVDITNYIMLEYGQPMHAYDLDNVEGKKIIVRDAYKNEKLETLDDQPHELNPGMITIADEKRAIGVAGVMGGANSEVTDSTTNILFESANFHPALVRRGAKALGMRTDASALFEKGLDPNNCMAAINRACELIEEMGAGEVVGGCIDVYPKKKENTVLDFEPEKINKFLGTDMAEADMIDYLNRLEFRVEDGKIIVPTFRGDVEAMADVAEEVARLYGYDNLPTTLMNSRVMAGGKTFKQKIESKVKTILTSYGLYETMTYSFIDPKEFEQTRVTMGEVVKILNPLGEENSVMRKSMLSSILKTMRVNSNRRASEAKAFEIGTVYLPEKPVKDGYLPEEKQIVAIGMYGSDTDFFSVKGIVQGLFDALGIKNYSFETEKENPSYHPGRCAAVKIGNDAVGYIGQVHPDVLEDFKIPQTVYAAELDFNTILAHATFDREYKELPKFPASSRDIAVVTDKAMSVREIELVIEKNRTDFLESYKLFDVYEGEQVGEGKKSVAYSITFRAADRTLTDSEINAVMDKILAGLKAIGAELR